LLQNVIQGLGLGQTLWNHLGNGKWILDYEHGILGVYRAGSLKTVASELAKYNLDLMAVQGVRWDNDNSEPGDDYKFFLQIIT